MIRKQQQETSPIGEKTAIAIALNILKWKTGLATGMNKWINHFSRQQQRWLLAAFCGVFSLGLILCLVMPYGQLAMIRPGNNYQPIHIGEPSQYPKTSPLKSNDSLTIKK